MRRALAIFTLLLVGISVFVGHFMVLGHSALMQHHVKGDLADFVIAVLFLLPLLVGVVALLGTGGLDSLRSRLLERGDTRSAQSNPIFKSVGRFTGLLLLYPIAIALHEAFGKGLALFMVSLMGLVWWFMFALNVSIVVLLQRLKKERAAKASSAP